MLRRLAYLGAGAAAVTAVGLASLLSSSTPAGGSKPRSPLSSLAAAVPPDRQQLVDILGVLRRPQTKADRQSALTGRLAGEPSPMFHGPPDWRLVRLATVTSWGDKVFLVPFKPLTRRSIARLPARRRQLAARWLASPRSRAEVLGIFDSTGAGCCSTATNIEAGGDWESSGPSPNTLILVVPDGVAKVSIQLSGGPRSRRSRVVSAIVHNNVAAFLSPFPVENLGVTKMVWRAVDGHVIKRSTSAS